jgi:hypothetical protein
MTSAKKSMTSVKFQERKPIFSRSFWDSRTIPLAEKGFLGKGRLPEKFKRGDPFLVAEGHLRRNFRGRVKKRGKYCILACMSNGNRKR